MEILLYDKTPVIGRILKDWLHDVVGTKAEVDFIKNYAGIEKIPGEKNFDLAIIDIDFPLDELYNLINSLCNRNAAMKLIFTTFRLNSNFDYNKISCTRFKTYDKSTGYFSFCDNIRTAVHTTNLEARCA